ncbi:hypothetical protein CN918_28105 [Priestia megaterium]|nr:hypothetical protein CN918_28105 [Priestia megaterium]
MKIKVFFIFTLLIVAITATATFMYTILKKPEEPTKIVRISNEPNDDVKVGEIALEKIKKEVNITSNTYEISYPFEKGMLSKDASMWDKTKYAFTGKNVTLDVHLSYELTSNLLHLSSNNVTFDKESRTLHITLDKPKLHTWLNTKKTDMNTVEAVFSGGFSDEERMRILDQAVEIGKKEIQSDDKRMKQSREDIIDGLTKLFSSIDAIEHVEITFRK